jgi:hypothetical protein
MTGKLDANAARRWRYNERLHYDALVDLTPGDVPVIPRPIDHAWWRSLLNGNFSTMNFSKLGLAEKKAYDIIDKRICA